MGRQEWTAGTNRRLRLGAFGVGRMGQVHVESLVRAHREGRVAFVALGDRLDATLASARALTADLAGAEFASSLCGFTSADAMAATAGLDAVVVASRTEHHAADALAFTRRNIPVLVEKPLAGSVVEAAAFVQDVGERGHRLVQVAFQRWYDDATRLAYEWVAAGRIGLLQHSHHVLQDKNPTPERYQSSGITADMAIHLVFEAMSFRGFELPWRVQALQFLAPPYDDRAGEGANVVHVFCQWAGGSLAHLWGSRSNPTGYDNGFKLIGTEGRIDVGEFAGDFGPVSARLWRGVGHGPMPRGTLAESQELPMTPPRSGHPDFYARFAAAYEGEVRAFIERAARGTAFEPGLDVGWKTLLVANVAEQSSRLGGRPFDLLRSDGGTICTPDDAAAFAVSMGVA